MRIDTDFIDETIYQIETQWRDKSWHLFTLSAEMFGEPSEWRKQSTSAPLAREFSACGRCWQQTGEHGTFDLKTGILAFATLTERYPTTIYRLVKRRWSVTTQTLAETP